jgi:hypothetical protein
MEAGENWPCSAKTPQPHHDENLSNLPQKRPIRFYAQRSLNILSPHNNIMILDSIGFPGRVLRIALMIKPMTIHGQPILSGT